MASALATFNKTKVKHFSISVLYDAKIKSSFCWRHFGDLIFEENNRKKKVATDQVFCNACLSSVQEENDEISFGL